MDLRSVLNIEDCSAGNYGTSLLIDRKNLISSRNDFTALKQFIQDKIQNRNYVSDDEKTEKYLVTESDSDKISLQKIDKKDELSTSSKISLNHFSKIIRNYQKLPDSSKLKSYPIGTYENFSTYFKKIDIAGLKMAFQFPFISQQKYNQIDNLHQKFGFPMTFEDEILIFESGEGAGTKDEDESDRYLRAFFISGNGKLSQETLDGMTFLE